MLPKHIRVGKKTWRVLVGKVPQGRSRSRSLGLCEYSTHTIHVSSRLGLMNRYQTLVHEVIHAAIPGAKEAQVLEAERALANVWRSWLREFGL